MHSEALTFVKEQVADLKPRFVVEIGSLYTAFAQPVDANPLRSLFQKARYVGIDVRPGPSVDIVADGATWQPDEAPDLVICCEVLEHVPPETQKAIVENAYAMLADGGTLIITAACEPRKPHTWDGHETGTPGVDYWNVTSDIYASVEVDAHEAFEQCDSQRGDIYIRIEKAPTAVSA